MLAHVTSGNVTPTRTNAKEATFTMPGSDVTIALNSLNLAGLVKVGDWIAYNTSGLSNITINSSMTGYTNVTVSPSAYTSGWRVLSNDGTTVKIYSVGNVASMILSGRNAYDNIANICANVNNAYLNSNFASAVSNPTTSIYSTIGEPVAYTGTNYRTTYQDEYDYYINLTSGQQSNVYDLNGSKTSSYAFRPIVTLKSNVTVEGGSGVSTDPYTLTLE